MSGTFFPFKRALIVVALLALLAGCSNWLPTSGPSTRALEDTTVQTNSMIQLVEINSVVNQRNVIRERRQLFSESFGTNVIPTYAVNPGDVLAVVFGRLTQPYYSVPPQRCPHLQEHQPAKTVACPIKWWVLMVLLRYRLRGVSV